MGRYTSRSRLLTLLYCQVLDQEEEIALNEFQKLEEKLSAKQGEKDSRCVGSVYS